MASINEITGKPGKQRAAHLLRRSTFGPTLSQINEFAEYTASEALDVMFRSELTLKERITWFYPTHLPSRWSAIQSSEAIYYRNCLFSHYAFGSFRSSLKRSAWIMPCCSTSTGIPIIGIIRMRIWPGYVVPGG